MPAINKIILGTVQFGLQYGINNKAGKPNEEQVASILDVAFANKIPVLDTAEAYGNSQELIGNYHRRSGNVFQVITKFSPRRDDLPAGLVERIRCHLKILHVDRLYGYMFHAFSDFKAYWPRHQDEIKELKKEGLIKKLGVSVYTNTEMEEAIAQEQVDLIQLPFNLLDNNNQRLEIIRKAKSKGIEVHTRSTFLQGLFFKNSGELPEKLAALEPYLREINSLSQRENINIHDLSLHYVCQQPDIDKVLIGVDSAAQLNQNLRSLNRKISFELAREIDRIHVKDTALLNPSNWNS